MNNLHRLQRIIAPLALGIGLTLGVSAPAIAHPRYSDSSYRNYHQRSFIEIQPFRSLNVTPRYHTPLPRSRYRYSDYERGYRSHDHRQRRVYRRGFRKPIYDRRYQNYDPDHYIRIRIR